MAVTDNLLTDTDNPSNLVAQRVPPMCPSLAAAGLMAEWPSGKARTEHADQLACASTVGNAASARTDSQLLPR